MDMIKKQQKRDSIWVRLISEEKTLEERTEEDRERRAWGRGK